MAQAKTKPDDTDFDTYLTGIAPERVDEARQLAAMFGEVSGFAPRIWAGRMVGIGRYEYRYDSGHSGEACRIGFSPRKAELVLYVLGGDADQPARLAGLGKHRAGKGCLYLKRLADVDMAVLEALVRDKIARMAAAYPE